MATRRSSASNPKTAPDADRALLTALVAAVQERKADDIVAIELRALSSFTDYFLICSGSSDRQVQAIADAAEECARAHGTAPLGIEGYDAGQWILLDFGVVVVHVFYPEARAFYQVEKMWADAPRLTI